METHRMNQGDMDLPRLTIGVPGFGRVLMYEVMQKEFAARRRLWR